MVPGLGGVEAGAGVYLAEYPIYLISASLGRSESKEGSSEGLGYWLKATSCHSASCLSTPQPSSSLVQSLPSVHSLTWLESGGQGGRGGSLAREARLGKRSTRDTMLVTVWPGVLRWLSTSSFLKAGVRVKYDQSMPAVRRGRTLRNEHRSVRRMHPSRTFKNLCCLNLFL